MLRTYRPAPTRRTTGHEICTATSTFRMAVLFLYLVHATLLMSRRSFASDLSGYSSGGLAVFLATENQPDGAGHEQESHGHVERAQPPSVG